MLFPNKRKNENTLTKMHAIFEEGYELEHSQDTRTNCEQNKNVLFRLTTIGTGEISCTRASGLIRPRNVEFLDTYSLGKCASNVVRKMFVGYVRLYTWYATITKNHGVYN